MDRYSDRRDLSKFATVLGAIFLLFGILGFVDALTPGGKLLGIFAVNTTHNWIHIISGVLGLAAGLSQDGAKGMAYAWFVVIAYGLVTLLGFVMAPGEGMLFNIVHVDTAGHLLHLGITLSAIVAIAVARRSHHYPA